MHRPGNPCPAGAGTDQVRLSDGTEIDFRIHRDLTCCSIDFRYHVLPKVGRVVPAGIVALSRAQEYGYTFATPV
jgi:hypothetical protein